MTPHNGGRTKKPTKKVHPDRGALFQPVGHLIKKSLKRIASFTMMPMQRRQRATMMNRKLVAALALVLCSSSVEAKLYADGACPLFALLPFTSM